MEIAVQTVESLFERQLKKLIDTRIASMKDDIAAGRLESLEKYKAMCGQIEGMRAVVDMMPDAREQAEQRNR